MKKLLLVLLLTASPAWSQTKPAKGAAAADPCAPIGRTEDGKLVYSLKCERLPAPPVPPPQAEVRDAPEPEPETRRTGLFGWSYDRR